MNSKEKENYESDLHVFGYVYNDSFICFDSTIIKSILYMLKNDSYKNVEGLDFIIYKSFHNNIPVLKIKLKNTPEYFYIIQYREIKKSYMKQPNDINKNYDIAEMNEKNINYYIYDDTLKSIKYKIL